FPLPPVFVYIRLTLLFHILLRRRPITTLFPYTTLFRSWNPHWMFAKYPDMKYLDDPKEIYGAEEGINSLARLGLEEDKPEAYKLIDQFEWEVEDMEQIMYEAQETGEEIEDVAKRWVEENEDKVAEWTDGVDDVDGVEVELVSTPWDSERASAGVLKEAMEQK